MTGRVAGGCVAVLCAALATAGCGVPTDRRARALDPHAAPYRLVVRDRAEPQVGTHRVVVYFVRDGALTPVPRRIPQPPTPASVLTALNAGPSDTERAQGLTSGLPVDADATVTASGPVVVVSVPTRSDSSNRSDTILAFGQLVLSLTALPNVSAVQFTQGGQPLQVPRSDGSLSARPLTRADYRELVDPS